MKKIGILLCLLFGLGACNSDDNQGEFQNTPLVIENILNSYMSSRLDVGEGREHRVIHNAEEWQELLNHISYLEYGNSHTTSKLEAVQLNFNNEIALTVIDEVKSSGGHSIDVVKVEEQEKEIVITIDRLHKGNITLVETQPFHIVKIPKKNKPIVFVEVEDELK